MSLSINLVNPHIRVAMNSVIKSGDEIKRRIIFDYELIFIEDGEFVLSYNDIDYKCSKGQFIFLRPAVPHSFKEILTDLSQPHIHFDITSSEESSVIPVSFKDLPDFSAEEKLLIHKDYFSEYPKTPFVEFRSFNKAVKLFYKIIEETSPLTKKAKLTELIDLLIRDNFPESLKQNESPYNISKQIKEYIDAGQGLSSTLDNLEKQFSYSKYHLEREFKKNYGISLMAYRNEKRMKTASKLLKRNNVSIVSESLGFSSIYVFSRAFKNYFGISPTQYKKKHSGN